MLVIFPSLYPYTLLLVKHCPHLLLHNHFYPILSKNSLGVISLHSRAEWRLSSLLPHIPGSSNWSHYWNESQEFYLIIEEKDVLSLWHAQGIIWPQDCGYSSCNHEGSLPRGYCFRSKSQNRVRKRPIYQDHQDLSIAWIISGLNNLLPFRRNNKFLLLYQCKLDFPLISTKRLMIIN